MTPSTIFIGRELTDENAFFVALDLKSKMSIGCSTLEKLLPLVLRAVKSKETISFNEVPYVADPSVTYMPLREEQFKELERMYERKVDMKTFPNPFVRE